MKMDFINVSHLSIFNLLSILLRCLPWIAIQIHNYRKWKMMFFLLSIISSVALSAPVDICMPSVFTVVESTNVHRDLEHEESHAMIYHDGKAMKVLIMHIEEHIFRRPLETELLDFTSKRHWHWDFRNRTVENCVLTNLEADYEPYCIAHQANMTGSGFLGEDFPFDSYVAREHRYGYRSEIEVLVEGKTTTKPLEKIERGEGHTHRFHEQRTYYDMVETPIPEKTFAIPDECPK